jgi:CMP-N,N'-diacetyllegionaminic acid synthase
MPNKYKHIALIPARSGSKRIPGKNTKLLNGVPLIAYTIASALECQVFSEVIVSTDSQEIAEVAKRYGASAPILRPSQYASDESSDIEWVLHAVNEMISTPKEELGLISILRPTSPLRGSRSILNALDLLAENSWADSVRAMEPTNKHPGKMWKVSDDGHATPFLSQSENVIPTHNLPTQLLPKVWIQNASLEAVKFRSLLETKSISGKSVLAIQLPGFEGYDLNSQEDWDYLEYLIFRNPELLRTIL